VGGVVLLRIGCRLELSCEAATPMLVLVHPHRSLPGLPPGSGQLVLQPDRSLEVLTDQHGNRWCRFLAAAGRSSFEYSSSIHCSDAADSLVPALRRCPVQFLPIDTYPFLNASTYCDTQVLMALAWERFGREETGWGMVQAICDWVHNQIRFDYAASRPHQSASQTLAAGAGVCRDFAHLAISLCRCLNIPARYCTGYLGYTGIPLGEAPVDFSAWFEAYLGDRWFVFDARHNIPRRGRVLIARGRDAGDVPFLCSFGEHQLVSFAVTTEEVSGACSGSP